MESLGRFKFFLVAGILILAGFSSDGAPINARSGGPDRFDKSATHPIIKYFLDQDVDEIKDELRTAFKKWEDVPTSYLRFEEVDSEAESEIWVTFGSTRNTEEFRIDYSEAGFMIKNHWLLNSAIMSQQGNARLATLIHEAGHAVGLRHSINNNTLMSYRRGSNVTLTVDDYQALTMIYPNDDNLKYPIGCFSVKSTNNDDFGAWGFAVVLLFTLIWLVMQIGAECKGSHLLRSSENPR